MHRKEHVFFLIYAPFSLWMRLTNPRETEMTLSDEQQVVIDLILCAERKCRPPCRMVGRVLEYVCLRFSLNVTNRN